ncbi:hypothetical protein Tco_1025569, partial [Tanacetum coccineum]
STVTARTRANEEVELTTTIDGHVKTVTEASLRRHLKLEDHDGVTSLPNSEIFEQLALIGKVEGLESELKHTKQIYNAALTKLVQRVKKLEQTVKTTKARRRVRIVVSEDEDALEDSSKQGRKISDIDEDLNIYLDEKEITTPANFQTYIRRRRGVSTGSGGVSTASRQDGTADISTASEIGSTAGEKAKDKGKAIMTEPEPEKKIKLQQRQERASLEAAIRLEE